MSKRFEVAHLREQGQDMIIVPLDDDFDDKVDAEKHRTMDALQTYASSAGLRGTVVPVWMARSGRMSFIAPKPWHPFFSTLSMHAVYANLNKELICG
jgi:hypothetical protein